jgi:DNA-binding NtrC family response regulator
MTLPKILIVDDDEMYAQLVVQAFKRDLFEISVCHSATELFEKLDHSIDIVILDYILPDHNGMVALKKIKAESPETSVIILSGQEDISLVSKLYKFGAYCYITKNDQAMEELAHKVRNLLNSINLKKEVKLLEEDLEDRNKYERIIGNGAATLRMLKMIQRVEKTDANVMISGESGTGKELIAKAVHYNSRRRKKPMVTVNIAAIPNNLIEDELFGHEKGAFTGAMNRRIGKFEEAQGGTIFLDEIGEMDISLQAKLLRVLQERKMTRLGGNKEIKLDVRIITATHRNLTHMVRDGSFREDLFYRIQGFPIQAPRLIDRGNDIILLAEHFLMEHAKKNYLPARIFSDPAKTALKNYKWPGNVRELITITEHAALMCGQEMVTIEDISFPKAQIEEAPNPTSSHMKEILAMIEDAKDNPDNNLFGLYRKLVTLRKLEPQANNLN